MQLNELKKIMQGLKLLYTELQEQFIKEGLDPTSDEFSAMQDKIREKFLRKKGFTTEEYRQAKAELQQQRTEEKEFPHNEIKSTLDNLVDKLEELPNRIKIPEPLPPPSQEETHKLLRQILEESKKKEQYEVTISPEDRLKLKGDRGEPGKSIKGDKGDSFDDAIIGYLEDKIEKHKIPDVDKLEKDLKEFTKDYFGENFKKNIDTLGMPDFRKLAMGLRQDIDRLDSTSAGGHTIQDEGVDLTQRTNLNFVGSGVTVTDDSANDQTDVTIAADFISSITDTASVDLTVAAGALTADVLPAGVDHGGLGGLADDDHTQYALLAGRSGGQTLIGGTATTDDLILRSTSAVGINTADIICQVGNNGSLEGLRVSGITAVGEATGGTITTDGNYTVHTFTSSGTFTPDASFNVDYLVVGGGGGGGGKDFAGNAVPGGGGGAGGFRTATGFAVTAQAYTITVGAGGAGGATNASGADGGNSVFSTITSAGGGGGGEFTNDPNGRAGGSGGGRVSNTGAGSGGAGNTPNTSPSQGNNGGGGATAGNWGCGGGGGASAVGADGLTTVGGAGGAGTSNSYSGSPVTYAGGGGGGMYSPTNDAGALGGAGGAGGGGAGGNGSGSNGTAGTANTGGGGGGAGGSGNTAAPSGGNGGSGIVIIRYLTPSSNPIAAAVGVGVTTPTAVLHLKAGTSTAKTSPLKFSSGTLLTTTEAGAVEFLTDKFYGTITTGAARAEFTLNNIALTATRVPFATTNGRLTDDADMTFDGTTLSVAAVTLNGRLQGDKGLDVASANNITLGTDGNYFDITGTTQINTISATGWQAGSITVLQFDGSVTVAHNTAGTGASILLSGSANFSATANDTLTLIYDSVTWRELARTTI